MEKTDWQQQLVCPECKAGLEKQEEGVFCLSCKQLYPVTNNIPVFSESVGLSSFFDQNTKKHGNSPLVYVNAASPFAKIASTHNFRLRKKAFEKIFNFTDKTILDIGCGTGNATDFLFGENHVYGLDISMEMLKLASSKGCRAVFSSLSRPLPFCDNYFDVIFCLGVIPYFSKEQLVPIFEELNRVVKKHGSVFLGSPSQGLIRRIPFLRKRKNKKIRSIYNQTEILPLFKGVALEKIYDLFFPFPFIREHKEPVDFSLGSNWIAELRKK